MPPPPPATVRLICASVSFSLVSKFGPKVPRAPAAASVWHPPHPADANTFRPSGRDDALSPQPGAARTIAPAARQLVSRGFSLRLRAPAPATAATAARLGLVVRVGARVGVGVG